MLATAGGSEELPVAAQREGEGKKDAAAVVPPLK